MPVGRSLPPGTRLGEYERHKQQDARNDDRNGCTQHAVPAEDEANDGRELHISATKLSRTDHGEREGA